MVYNASWMLYPVKNRKILKKMEEFVMSKNKDKHKHSSNKIRAKNKIFINSEYEKSFNQINVSGSILCHDDLDNFRRNEKSVVATIERQASNRIKANLKVSDQSVDIIQNNYNHNNPYVVGFIDCIISSYNEAHMFSSLIDMSAAYKTKRQHKIMQQAEKNCQKTIKTYVDKIIAKMKSGQWKNITEYDIAKYEAIEPAVQFFCDYIEFLVIGTIPSKINNEDYILALELDVNIKNYYSKNNIEDCFVVNTNANKRINIFNQECLTFLFCRYINS